MKKEFEVNDLFDAYSAMHSHVGREHPVAEASPLKAVVLQTSVESSSFPITLSELVDLAPGVTIGGFSPLANMKLKLEGEHVADVELCMIENNFVLRVTNVHQSMIPDNNQFNSLLDEEASQEATHLVGEVTS